MAQITQFSVGGDIVYVETVEKLSPGGEQRAATIETIGKYLKGDVQTEKVPDLAERAAPIVKALKAIREKIVEIGSPDETELEAGIKFTGEAGVILSKYGAEASISVKLTWKKPEASPKPAGSSQ